MLAKFHISNSIFQILLVVLLIAPIYVFLAVLVDPAMAEFREEVLDLGLGTPVDSRARVFTALDNNDQEIWFEEVANGELRQKQITDNQFEDILPVFDPITRTVVWQELVDNLSWQIFTRQVDFGEATQLTFGDGTVANEYPYINDGIVVWQSYDGPKSKSDIYAFSGAGTELVYESSGSNLFPKVESGRVFWENQDDRRQNIYSFDLNSKAIKQLTQSGGNTHLAVGYGKAVWQGQGEDSREIYLYDIQNNNLTEVTHNEFDDALPKIINGKLVWRQNLVKEGKVGLGGNDVFQAVALRTGEAITDAGLIQDLADSVLAAEVKGQPEIAAASLEAKPFADLTASLNQALDIGTAIEAVAGPVQQFMESLAIPIAGNLEATATPAVENLESGILNPEAATTTEAAPITPVIESAPVVSEPVPVELAPPAPAEPIPAEQP